MQPLLVTFAGGHDGEWSVERIVDVWRPGLRRSTGWQRSRAGASACRKAAGGSCTASRATSGTLSAPSKRRSWSVRPWEFARHAGSAAIGRRGAGLLRGAARAHGMPRAARVPHGGRPGVRAPGRRLRARAAPTPRVVMTGLPAPVAALLRASLRHVSRFIRVSWTGGSRRSAPHRLRPRAGVADTSCHSGTKGTVGSRPLPMAPLHLGSPRRSAAEHLGASSLGFDMARCRHDRSRTGRYAYRLGLACRQTGQGPGKISRRRRPRNTPPGRAQSSFHLSCSHLSCSR
jgi:hypothetical protein